MRMQKIIQKKRDSLRSNWGTLDRSEKKQILEKIGHGDVEPDSKQALNLVLDSNVAEVVGDSASEYSENAEKSR